MEKGANFSACGNYRYFLFRIWDRSKPVAMCIGLNPSKASDSKDDPTISGLIRMLTETGFGGFYMTNLFALVSPHPEDLRMCPDPLKENDAYLEEVSKKCAVVIFCWGNFKQAAYRERKIIKQFPDALCFGKNAHGKPMHPLAANVWMRKHAKLQRFDGKPLSMSYPQSLVPGLG